MTETILIVVGIYLAIGAFWAGLVAENGYVKFANLCLMMILWPFLLIALLGAFVGAIISRFLG